MTEQHLHEKPTSIHFAALFDMDGVLIDSVKYHWQAMNEILADYNIHINDDDLRKYIGQPLYRQVKQLSDEYNAKLDYEDFERRTTARKLELLENMPPKDGVVALLELLQQNHVPMAVATSNTKVETERRLDVAGIRHYFTALVTEDDVTEHKPDPTVYLTAAQAVHENPTDCVVFEDAPAGITAAKRAGMKCIAVQTPYTIAEDLTEADESVPTLQAVTLPSMLKLFS